MEDYQTIANKFHATIETIMASVDELAGPLGEAGHAMTNALLQDRKVLACGLGADAATAQLLACNLLGRFERERPALPAISLATDCASATQIAGGEGLDEVFARQLRALGQAGDVLVCFDSGDQPGILVKTVAAGREREMIVVAVRSANAGPPPGPAVAPDVDIPISAVRRPGIIELQVMVVNCLCELIDQNLFGQY